MPFLLRLRNVSVERWLRAAGMDPENQLLEKVQELQSCEGAQGLREGL